MLPPTPRFHGSGLDLAFQLVVEVSITRAAQLRPYHYNYDVCIMLLQLICSCHVRVSVQVCRPGLSVTPLCISRCKEGGFSFQIMVGQLYIPVDVG
jgi:hypothetical protein